MTRGVRLTTILALAFMAALAIFVSQSDSSSAQPPFEPGAFVCYETLETDENCDGDASAGAVTDIHGSFCIGWNQDCSTKDAPVVDSNFGAVVGFVPPEFPLPAAGSVPVGAIAGRLTSEATLGVLNNPCGLTIQVAFTLMNASININDTIDPLPPGETDVFEPLALDANGNGIPDGVDKYPSFLNETFKNTQPIARLFGIGIVQGSWVALNFVFFEPGVTLEAANRTVTFDPALGVPSITVLNNPEAPAAPGAISDFCAPLLSDNIALGITVDNPCTPTPVPGAACPPGSGTPVFENRGYPLFPCEAGNVIDEDGDGAINDGCPQVNSISESGADCNNDTSDDGEDTAVNDGCPQSGDKSENSRLGGACSGGDEGGCVFRQNPASAGTVRFTTLTASQRDSDGDGIENSLDVCWDDPNPDWDPRAADPVNDPDSDGLANECDPSPNERSAQLLSGCKAGIVGPDEDSDCFSNRADNCPLVSQLQDPNAPAEVDVNAPIITDEDSDGVGDACDPDPNDPEEQGEPAFICLNMELGVGGGATKAVSTPDPDQSLDCATSQVVETTPTPVGQTPTPIGQTPPPGGTGGVGNGDVDTGIGSLAPTSTNVSVWAILLAVLGGVGVLAGIRILRSRRVDSDE